MSDARVKCPYCGETLLVSEYRSLRSATKPETLMSEEQIRRAYAKLLEINSNEIAENIRLTVRNAELLAACRYAMAAPDAFAMKAILGSVLSEVSDGN